MAARKSSSSFVKKIDQEIKCKSVLNHPFYQKWSQGELTIDQLRGYSKEYFALVRAVPDLVSNAIKSGENGQIDKRTAESIRRNLREEREHIALWLRFCKSLGLSTEEVERYDPASKTKEAVEELTALTSSTFEESVSALYAYELELPKISSTKIEGLKKFYNLQTPDALVYFETHEVADVRHALVWREVLERVVNPAKQAHVLKVATSSLESQWKLLDSVMETYVN
jgi:pyrroloquinoline-quinone synthase